MVDVFEEVEEELRSERYKRLFRTWGPWIGGGLLIALVAALSWWGWQSWNNDRIDRVAVAYDEGRQALSENNREAADAAFLRVIEEGSGAYKAMALQQRAGLALDAGRNDEAVELFDEAARASREPLLADLARLKAVYLLMNTAAREDVSARLEPLAADGRPFSAYAREAQGMLMLQHGEAAEARPVFAVLSLGQDIPEDVRQRAQLALDAIDSGVAASIPGLLDAQSALAEAAAAATSPTPQEQPAS